MVAPTGRNIGMNNPFIWNSVSTSLFFGRDALLNEILSGLPGGARCSYGVTGGRRMGKSTLLRAIEEDLTNSLLMWRESGLVVVPIYLDGLTFDRPIDPNALWKRIIKEIGVAVGDLKSYDVRDFADFVSTSRTLIDRSELAVRVVVPVSYTHLDVYKRQIQQHASSVWSTILRSRAFAL